MLVLDGVAIDAVGRTDDVCPTCGSTLSKRPLKLRPCEHCGEPIYVRTRPLDGKRVLASKAQTEVLKSQWDAFMEFKRFIYQLAALDPRLRPLYEDLHRGRRGEALIDEQLVLEVAFKPAFGGWRPIDGFPRFRGFETATHQGSVPAVQKGVLQKLAAAIFKSPQG